MFLINTITIVTIVERMTDDSDITCLSVCFTRVRQIYVTIFITNKLTHTQFKYKQVNRIKIYRVFKKCTELFQK